MISPGPAIKIHLQNHDIRHIPVDAYKIPGAYDDDVDDMYRKIINITCIETRDFRSAIAELVRLEKHWKTTIFR